MSQLNNSTKGHAMTLKACSTDAFMRNYYMLLLKTHGHFYIFGTVTGTFLHP